LVGSDVNYVSGGFASDILVQVYVDVNNDDIIYRSELFFMNRNTRRPYKIGS